MDYKSQAAEFYRKPKAQRAADKVLKKHQERTESKRHEKHEHDEKCEKDCKK